MVHNSPWPIAIAFSLLSIVVEFVANLHEHQRSSLFLIFNIIFFLVIFMRWCADVRIEATFEGRHTKLVQKCIKNGFFLFILSEIMFFGALFGSYIYIITHPNIWIGCQWPPSDLFELNPFLFPLANCFLLLFSGVMTEFAHESISLGNWKHTYIYLITTMFFGILFLMVQLIEYTYLPFGMSDSIFGSLFYFITGFHGLHVLIGLLFIYVQFNRLNKGDFTRNHHLGLDLAIWYWHFVDIIWLIVWFLIYLFPTHL
jgi:cytochrome c oxidase subunit 3